MGCPDEHRLAQAVVTSLAEHFDQHEFRFKHSTDRRNKTCVFIRAWIIVY